MLVESTGFAYTQKIARANSVTWWCSKRSKSHQCSRKVLQLGKDFRHGAIQHDNPADFGLGHKINIARQDGASNGVYRPVKRLVEAAFHDIIKDTYFCLPDQELIAVRANRCRQEMRLPHGLDFGVADYAVPDGFLRRNVGMDDACHIIMATKGTATDPTKDKKVIP